MTVEELYQLLCDHADATLETRECPDMDEVLRQIAEWVHIDQKGFAKSDLVHMELECRALNGTRYAVCAGRSGIPREGR